MFRKATLQDLARISEIYEEIHSAAEDGQITTDWVRGVYPTRATAEASIRNKDMFVEEEQGRIVAAARINQEQMSEYSQAAWSFQAPADQVMVLHTLVVSPTEKGKGYGSGFVAFYEKYAQEHGCPYLRMDTGVRNLTARALYRKLGYREASIVSGEFNGIQNMQLVCLEKTLNPPERNCSMNQKVLFFDIDGTLLDQRYNVPDIPDGVKKEMRRLQSLGHKLFISSGRPKAMLDDRLLQAGFDGYILTNGAYVIIDGKPVHEDRMDYDLCLKTVRILEELGCEYMIETADYIYIDHHSDSLYQMFSNLGQKDRFIQDFDRDEILKEALKLEINVLEKDRELVEESILKHFGHVACFDTHGTDHAYELYSSTVSKATGIQKVLDHLGLSQADSYAFGDGTNDIEMLQYCGTGVAMGNAVPELKAVADIICPPINENGLEKILRELFPI